jgi:hypothetical protein
MTATYRGTKKENKLRWEEGILEVDGDEFMLLKAPHKLMHNHAEVSADDQTF